MILNLTAKTNIPDVYIDFIEVQLKNGEEVSLNWDESEISRTDEGFSARYKGVYFNEEYANGRIADLSDFKIIDIGLYYESEGSFHFEIEEMEFDDAGQTLLISKPVIPPECSGLQNLNLDEKSAAIEMYYKALDFMRDNGITALSPVSVMLDLSNEINVSPDILYTLSEKLIEGIYRSDEPFLYGERIAAIATISENGIAGNIYLDDLDPDSAFDFLLHCSADDFMLLVDTVAKENQRVYTAEWDITSSDYVELMDKLNISIQEFQSGEFAITKSVIAESPAESATFVSVWDGGYVVETGCKVNRQTGEVFDIEVSEGTADFVNNLDEEYIRFADGSEFTVERGNANEGFWYDADDEFADILENQVLEKPTLSEQIQSAANRAADLQHGGKQKNYEPEH